MKFQPYKSILGYTAVELLVVIVVIGILSAIAGPSLLGLLSRLRLNTAQAEALTVMREAQNNAKREKRVWQASFRKYNERVQWSVHPDSSEDSRIWNDLIGEDADKIDILNNYTTLRNSNGIYFVQFQYKGRVNGQLGRITFVSRGVSNNSKAPKRCVFVSTLLGAMRTDSDRGCQN